VLNNKLAKFEVLVFICLIALGVTWILLPEENIEPYFATISLIFIGAELFRRGVLKLPHFNISRSSDTVELSNNNDEEWNNLIKKFPTIIREMATDVKNPDFVGVRSFFVKKSNLMVNSSEPRFEYHTDVHPDLSAAIFYLEDIGYIQDITPGNCPMFRFYESFYDKLYNS
jgi:hypothetical protein